MKIGDWKEGSMRHASEDMASMIKVEDDDSKLDSGEFHNHNDDLETMHVEIGDVLTCHVVVG